MAANPRTEWLDVTGGEIFLRSDIEAILDAILRTWTRLVVLHFRPTGSSPTASSAPPADFAASIEVPIVVTVSLDGDEVLNDRIRGITGGYRRQIETFNRLRAEGVTVVLGMTVSRFNVDRVDDVFRAVRRDCPASVPDNSM